MNQEWSDQGTRMSALTGLQQSSGTSQTTQQEYRLDESYFWSYIDDCKTIWLKTNVLINLGSLQDLDAV